MRLRIGRIVIVVLILLVLILVPIMCFRRGPKGESIEELVAKALLEKSVRELYEEAKEKPYFENHPEELVITELEIVNFMFTKGFIEERPINNLDREFNKGEEITFSFDVDNYMNPKVKDNQYLYGITVLAETKDSEGNIVESLTQQIIDTANHHEVKGVRLRLNLRMIPDDNIQPGEYVLKVTALDKISGINKTIEREFNVI